MFARFKQSCVDLFNLSPLIAMTIALALAAVGWVSVATLNVGLMVVVALGAVVVLRLLHHSAPDAQPAPDEADRLAAIRHKAESFEAAEAARRFLREPSIKQVMPRHESVEL